MEWGIANHIDQINAESFSVQVPDEVTLVAHGVGSTRFRVKETDFLWTHSVAVSDGTFAHRTQHMGESRFLDMDFVRSENFWATSIQTAQGKLSHAPKFLALNAELEFQFIDTSNAGNVVALYLYGFRAATCGAPGRDGRCKNPNCKCDRARWGQGRGLFIVGTPGPTTAGTWAQGGVAVPALGQNVGVIKIPEYYHFRCGILNGSAFNGAGGTTANTDWKGNIDRMDPRDERRGYLTSAENKQARAKAFVGTSTAPNRLPSPFVCHKASQMTVDLTDLGNSNTNNVHLTMIGELIDDELLASGG